MNAVIISERDRRPSEDDQAIVEEVLTKLYDEHGFHLTVVSIGCDLGVGQYVLNACTTRAIRFAEMRVKFTGKEFSRQFFAQIFKARNLSLLHIGDLFYFFLGPNPRGLVAEVVDLAKDRVGPSRVTVYPYQPPPSREVQV